jgi:hypothetical protein
MRRKNRCVAVMALAARPRQRGNRKVSAVKRILRLGVLVSGLLVGSAWGLPPIYISEINYDPKTTGEPDEFVEVYNLSDQSYSLGTDFYFYEESSGAAQLRTSTTKSVAPRSFLVLVASYTGFNQSPPTTTYNVNGLQESDVADLSDLALNNGGETVFLSTLATLGGTAIATIKADPGSYNVVDLATYDPSFGGRDTTKSTLDAKVIGPAYSTTADDFLDSPANGYGSAGELGPGQTIVPEPTSGVLFGGAAVVLWAVRRRRR